MKTQSIKQFFSLASKFLFMYYLFRGELFLRAVAAKYDQKNKKLLDIGAGESPYRKYFKHTTYVTYDIKQNLKHTIDIVGDINRGIPKVSSKSFDYILCVQVLEHLSEPHKVFGEFNRILKEGGKVFLSTNFFYQIHMAPYDYFRFTKYGLQHLAESNGFHVDRIEPHGGIFHTISYLVATLPIRIVIRDNKYLYYFYLFLFSVPIVLLNLVAFFLDHFDKHKEITINYAAIFTKQGRKS